MKKLSPLKPQLFSYPSNASLQRPKISHSPKARPITQSYKKLLIPRMSKEEIGPNIFNIFNYDNC